MSFERLNSEKAIPACTAAVSAADNLNKGTDNIIKRRGIYQLGRALNAAKQYSDAKQHYETAVALGSSSAMNGLGRLYDEGWGVGQDYGMARGWYERAVAAGDVAAMSNLGVLYDIGQGVTQDYGTARGWYEKAAAAGHPAAMANLGTLHNHGRGVPQNNVTARYWWQKAAEAGETTAMVGLGALIANGQGVVPDSRVERDYRGARDWWEKAANAGNVDAMMHLGEVYMSGGFGLMFNSGLARIWWERAADKGNATAMNHVGVIYYDIVKDSKMARVWWERAAAAGNMDAKTNLQTLSRDENIPPAPNTHLNARDRYLEASRSLAFLFKDGFEFSLESKGVFLTFQCSNLGEKNKPKSGGWVLTMDSPETYEKIQIMEETDFPDIALVSTIEPGRFYFASLTSMIERTDKKVKAVIVVREKSVMPQELIANINPRNYNIVTRFVLTNQQTNKISSCDYNRWLSDKR